MLCLRKIRGQEEEIMMNKYYFLLSIVLLLTHAYTYTMHSFALVNQPDDQGRTPLHYASERLEAPRVNLLLEQGANPNIPDKSGQTPLECTVPLVARGGISPQDQDKSIQVVTALINHGARVESAQEDAGDDFLSALTYTLYDTVKEIRERRGTHNGPEASYINQLFNILETARQQQDK